MTTCYSCGAANAEGATSCRMCAAPLDSPAPTSAGSDMIICAACGSENEAGWLYCQHCGNRLSAAESPTPTISEQMAIPSTKETPQVPAPSEPQAESESPAMTQAAHSGSSLEAKTVEEKIPKKFGSAPEGKKLYLDYRTTPEGEVRPQYSDPESEARQSTPAEIVLPTASEGADSLNTTPDPIPPLRITCSTCGMKTAGGGLFCTSCGAQLTIAGEKEATGKPQSVAKLELITEGGKVGQNYTIEREETLIGRVEGDLTFPHDVYLSGRHARVIERDGRYFLVDQNSRNGTFIRISKEVELKPGDIFLVGKQVFRFNKT